MLPTAVSAPCRMNSSWDAVHQPCLTPLTPVAIESLAKLLHSPTTGGGSRTRTTTLKKGPKNTDTSPISLRSKLPPENRDPSAAAPAEAVRGQQPTTLSLSRQRSCGMILKLLMSWSSNQKPAPTAKKSNSPPPSRKAAWPCPTKTPPKTGKPCVPRIFTSPSTLHLASSTSSTRPLTSATGPPLSKTRPA